VAEGQNLQQQRSFFVLFWTSKKGQRTLQDICAMSILKKYNKHLLKRGYNGPLSFHQPYRLGHIITFNKRSGFEIVGHIEHEHFRLSDFKAIEKSGEAEADIDFGTETGVNIEVKLSGDAVIPGSRLEVADAGLVIEFENKASYLLKTSGTRVHFIENVAQLGEQVNQLYRDRQWNRHWFIITKLIEADRATLLISRSRNAKVELKAEGNLSSLSEEDLVDADLKFSILSKREMSTNIIGKEGPYFPLFKANGVQVRRLFGQPVGSDFLHFNELPPMQSFTLADLDGVQPPFGLEFVPYDFAEELMEDEDLA
jgi:hypothetical protein